VAAPIALICALVPTAITGRGIATASAIENAASR